MKTRHTKDYVAMWFDVRREQGINDEMSVGPMDTLTREVDWHTFAHRDMDGLGGIATILRQNGYPCAELPRSSEKAAPGFWEVLRLMFKKSAPRPPRQVRWLRTYPDYRELNPENTNQAPIATDFLTEAETTEVKQQAKKARVALNVYLFWALNRAISHHLMASGQPYYWFFPVNLRGAVNFDDDTQNCSSGVCILVSETISPRELQEAIKTEIKAKAHWVMWVQGHIGKLIGKRGVRWIYQKMSQRNHYAGSFSFLGSWPLQEAGAPDPVDNQVWVSCGIGTENYPVSTGILLWHNQLTLGLKLHPYICRDFALTQQCLQTWKQTLLGGVHG